MKSLRKMLGIGAKYTPIEANAVERARADLKEAQRRGETCGFAHYYDDNGRKRVMAVSSDGAVSSWEPGA